MPTEHAPAELRERIIAALRTVHDPEIPVNVYDLGLIYGLEVSEQGDADVLMTLTAPNCPVAEDIVRDVRAKVEGVEGVRSANVRLTFEPAWTTERMSEIAEIELEAMGIDPRRAKESAGVGFRPTGLTIGRRPAGR